MHLYYLNLSIFALLLAPLSEQQIDSETEDESEPDPRSVEQTLVRALELHRQRTSQTTGRPTRKKDSPHDKSAEQLLNAMLQPSTSGIQVAKLSIDEIEEVEEPVDDTKADPDWDPNGEVLRLPQVDVSLDTMKLILKLRESGRSHDKIHKQYDWYNHKFIPRFKKCVARGYRYKDAYRLMRKNLCGIRAK